MITKGKVVEIVDTYSARVRIPIWDKEEGAKNSTKNEDLSIATILRIANQKNPVHVGDVVFVGFEDHEMERPIILGVLYSDYISEDNSDLEARTFRSTSTTKLSRDTWIGDITPDEIARLKGVKANIQAQLDLFRETLSNEFNISIDNINSEIDNIYSNSTYKATLNFYANSKEEAQKYFNENNINNVTVLISEDDSVYTYSNNNFTLNETFTAKELVPGLNYFISDLSILANGSIDSEYFGASGTVIYSKDGNWQVQFDKSKAPDNEYIQYNEKKQLTVNKDKVAVYITDNKNNLGINKSLDVFESNNITTSNINIKDDSLSLGNAKFTDSGNVYSGSSAKSDSIKQVRVDSDQNSYPILLSGIIQRETDNTDVYSTPKINNNLYYNFATNKLVVDGNIELSGDITTSGKITNIEVEDAYIEDNYIHLRYGATTGLTELGDGNSSGIVIHSYAKDSEGKFTDALVALDNTGTLRIGDRGDLQAVATREDKPNDKAIAYWDSKSNSFKTNTDILISNIITTNDLNGYLPLIGDIIEASYGTLNITGNVTIKRQAPFYSSLTLEGVSLDAYGPIYLGGGIAGGAGNVDSGGIVLSSNRKGGLSVWDGNGPVKLILGYENDNHDTFTVGDFDSSLKLVGNEDTIPTYNDYQIITANANQTITGLKTFKNSLKIGNATLSYNETVKALEISVE